MKKNIFIGVLLVLTLLSFVYAFIQQAESKMQERLARQNAQKAVESERKAKAILAELERCRINK